MRIRRWHDAGLVLPVMLVALAAAACAGDDDSSGSRQSDAGKQPAAPGTGASTSIGTDAKHDAGQASCPDPGTTAPLDVFCIGLYENHDSKLYAASALPYTPGVLLWSDGAEKQRYLALPPGTKIDTSDMDAWKFPVGTKAFKEFRFGGKLVETRMIWKQAEHNTVYATYIWDANETDAPLNQSSKPTILDTGYEIPDAKDCGRCHHGAADKYLGLEAVELALPTAKGLTLAKLAADRLLTDLPARTSITLPEDSTGKAGFAIGYLHVNCGMPCHSDRGLGDETNLLLRLRADEFWPSADADAGSASGGGTVDASTTDVFRHAVNQKPTTASVAQKFPGALRITPGDHAKSLIWLLADRRGEYQMPPLVTHKVDEPGMQKLADWIDALPH